MIRIGLRDARSHFGRFAMSIVAIMLGVAFVVGSFCFRAMLDNQVSQMMSTNMDHDVYVRGATETSGGSSSSGLSTVSTSKTYNSIDLTLVATIRGMSGVSSASATESLSGVVLVDRNGNAVSTMGSPTIAVGMSSTQPWRSAHFLSGTMPKGDSQIALHQFAASKSKLRVGDTTTVVYPDGPKTVTVSGIFATDSSQAGAIILGADPSVVTHYQNQNSAGSDKTSYIGVYGNSTTPLDDAQQQQLADKINKALPRSDHAYAITGDSMRADATKSTQDELGFVQPLILIFAVIALFVGSFIIANTFSMIVRESMRGYALLRSIGASPSQVFATVIVQALVLGLTGSALGIGLGWAMIRLIVSGLSHMGTPLTGATNPTPSGMLAGLLVGMIVTLVGASLPARNAALAPPIQAMNETVNPERPVLRRGVLGSVMCALGIASWLFTWALASADKSGPTPWPRVNDLPIGWPLGCGAGLLVIGVIVLGPALVAPAGKTLGWLPSHIFPVTGRLSTRNLSRSKRRTANTAAALFVGIAIVSCLTVVAASAKSSVSSLIDTGMKADFAVSSASSRQIPQGAITAIQHVSGVKSTVANRLILDVTYNGRKIKGTTIASQKGLFTDVFQAQSSSGDASKALRSGELVVGKNIADDRDWHVGERVTVTTRNTVVDKTATQKAQSDYAAQVQAKVQKLTAAHDLAGAQKEMAAAKNVDPRQFIVTTTQTTTERLTIGAIVTNSVYRDGVIVNDTVGDKLGTPSTMITLQMFVSANRGENLAQLQKRLQKSVKSYYVVTVMNHDEYKSVISSMIDQIMLILYALLALSIVIAIFGIVNTLALSVSERTKEIGLLRAIGTSRGQVRGMLAIEASIISVFGTILGLLVGVGAGAIIRVVYANQGLEVLSVPWMQLLAFLVLSIVVGMVASMSPATRALKKPVLDAVASE